MDDYRPLPGTPLGELDTPCLLIDLDNLEHNFQVVADTYRDTETKMRMHTKNVKSPLIAALQIRAGGTNGGVCTAKTAEAEVMVEGGIEDVLIPNQIVTRDKIARLCALAKRARITVGVDDTRNLADISDVAVSQGSVLGVVIEVDTSMHRAGIRRVEQGVELAKMAQGLPGVEFRGVMSHQSVKTKPDRETRFLEGRRFMQMCMDVVDAIKAEDIPVEIVSTGETWTYDVAADVAGVTEVEGGTYALMSTNVDYMEDLRYAAKVLGTVISTPRPGIAIGDVGSMALASSPPGMLPSIEGSPGVRVEDLYEDQIVLRSDGQMPLRVGDTFLLRSGQQDIMVNRWDQYIAVRDGLVEAVWDIPGRGCHN